MTLLHTHHPEINLQRPLRLAKHPLVAATFEGNSHFPLECVSCHFVHSQVVALSLVKSSADWSNPLFRSRCLLYFVSLAALAQLVVELGELI